MAHFHFGPGDVVGSLSCVDPKTGQDRVIISVSGKPEDVEVVYAEMRDSVRQDYVFAPAVINQGYWAGHDDFRFQAGRNADGSIFEGDSLTCPEPRLYQCARENGWIVTGMSLLWRGSGPNPFPDESKDNESWMKPCPSCAANRNSILAGVRRPTIFSKLMNRLKIMQRDSLPRQLR